MIEDRPWDSDVTGYRCGTVNGLADLRHRAVWQHLVAFSDADDWTRIRSLEAEGFKLVGCRVEYVRAPRVQESRHMWCELIRATDDDMTAISDHAAASFTRSRFHADPLLAPMAGEIHRRWIASCRERDEVYAGRSNLRASKLRGYVCAAAEDTPLQWRVALIGAIETEHGAGQAMLDAMHDRSLRAKTQAGNRAACRMYERAGFLLDGADVVHSWSPGT